jgi:hypothetical protein
MWFWASRNVEWILVSIAMAMLIAPIILYLSGPWDYRKREILGLLSDNAIQLFFERFFANTPPEQRNLPAFYDARFGRWRYAWPLVLLGLVTIIPLDWTIETALVATGRGDVAARLPAPAAAAIAGAYVWVSADLLWRWQFRDLLPIHVTWAALRFTVAVPIGYAFGSVAAADHRVFIAFGISAFPTTTLLTLTRRVFRRKLGLGDLNEKAESELEKLQGINTRVAERLADEGYTTIVQLAYADPIELTMRCSSLSFSFVIDCASQALAWIYLQDNLASLRLMSLRGAQEIAAFVAELDDHANPGVVHRSRKILEAAAEKVAVPSVALERTFREIAEDPYTEFLQSVWLQQEEPAEEQFVGA